ncbi:hypothetical protein ONZ43_g852 [Nemania bipapillata]|uniref:Uncharacterized protein n=1 Tax=Nemania bipapillata TaxID=110536 RepID=A0ACC2J702_9PEZI|nr:hypothetical protein ONZ43_g852 [Nemania bipapillata]
MVYNLVSRKVATRRFRKLPQDVVFEGERNRFFLGTSRQKPIDAIVKRAKRLADGTFELELAAGKAHGVTEAVGSGQMGVYDIYPSNQPLETALDYGSPLASCKVFEVHDFVSKAHVEDRKFRGDASYKVVRRSEIFTRCIKTPKRARIIGTIPSLNVEALTPEHALVNLTKSETPFFTISSSSHGGFKVAFTLDKKELAVDVRSEDMLQSHLMHIGIYDNLLNLVRPSGHGNGIQVQIIGSLPQGNVPAPQLFDPSDPFYHGLGEPQECGPHPYEIHENQWLGLRVRNRTQKTLFIEILDLAPSWKASRVYPTRDNPPTMVLRGEPYDFFIKMTRANSISAQTQSSDHDSIIVLASTNAQGHFQGSNILPQLAEPFDWPLRKVESSRDGEGVDSDPWFAKRVDVRVVNPLH